MTIEGVKYLKCKGRQHRKYLTEIACFPIYFIMFEKYYYYILWFDYHLYSTLNEHIKFSHSIYSMHGVKIS